MKADKKDEAKAQQLMYILTGAFHALSGSAHDLFEEADKVNQSRRDLLKSFPTLDICKKESK